MRDTGRWDQEQPVPVQVKGKPLTPEPRQPPTLSRGSARASPGTGAAAGAGIWSWKCPFPSSPLRRVSCSPHLTCLCWCGLTTFQALDTVWDWDQLETASDSCSNLHILPQPPNTRRGKASPGKTHRARGSGSGAGHWTHGPETRGTLCQSEVPPVKVTEDLLSFPVSKFGICFPKVAHNRDTPNSDGVTEAPAGLDPLTAAPSALSRGGTAGFG